MYGLYGAGSASSQARMVGLASGLDTESLVKGMTATVRNKITQQTQSRQSLLWKMDAYRSVSSKMIDFSNKYLTYTSSTNALSSAFFSGSKVAAKGDNAGLLTVSGGTSAANSVSIVGINSTASTAGFVSNKNVADTKISTGSVVFGDAGKTVNNLSGETINLSYGGKNYDIKIDSGYTGTTTASAVDAFNEALAAIELDGGGTLADKISMGNIAGDILQIGLLDTADTGSVKIIGGSKGALSSLGLTVGDSASNADGPITGSADASTLQRQVLASDASGKSMTFELNGSRRSVTIGTVTDNSAGALVQAMQEGFDNAYGANRVRVGVSGNGEITFEAVRKDSSNNVVPDETSTLTMLSVDAELFGEKGVLNTEGHMTNRLSMNDSLGSGKFETPLQENANGRFELSVNGKTFEFGKDQTLRDVMDTINRSDAGVTISYLNTKNSFSVTASDSGAHGRVDISDVSGNLAASLFGSAGTDYQVSGGSDAEIAISYDGGKTQSLLTRSSNSFDIEGMSVKLTQGAENLFDAAKPITFEQSVDSDEVIKRIQGFVDDYNSIMDLANKELSVKPDKKYYPLTSDMRAEMSDKEVEIWEEKANSGLLYNDATMRSLSSDLRFAFSIVAPGGSGALLSDFGITTGSSWQDNGKISIDQDKLRKALEERPDDVIAAFTAPKNTASGASQYDAGVAYRVKDVMDKYAATIGQHKGSLILMAGVKDSLLGTESRLQKQVDEIDAAIGMLQRRQKTQEDRYYKQFATLEKYVSQMNMQSSWLNNQ